MSSPAAKPYPPGIHVPCLTWFTNDTAQDIDWKIQEHHLEFLIKSGLDGLVLAGTTGEAVTLSRDEKFKLVKTAREIASKVGRPNIAITMGTSGQCTRDVVAEAVVAKESGADFALVLTPSYFHMGLTKDAMAVYFEEVASRSPLPVVIYNFPGVVSGLDVDSEMLDRLAKHPNIVGVKLTCGSIAKVTRLSASYKSSEFAAVAGQSDWLIPALSVGGAGAITGVANVYPKVCMQIYDLYVSGKVAEATALQLEVGKAEWGFAKGGFNGMKWIVGTLLGYPEDGLHMRRPYPNFDNKDQQAWLRELVEKLGALEANIAQRAS